MTLELVATLLAPIAIYSLFGLLFIPFVLYAFARWRAHREPIADPQLGLKVALSYFALAGFHVALVAVATLAYALLSSLPSDDKGELYRIGFGLLVPGAIVCGAHVALLRRTNQDQFPGVRKLFLGFNLVITGLVGFAALVLAFESLVKRGGAGEGGRIAGATTLVYGGAWAACGLHFGRFVLRGYVPPSGPPPEIVPPSQLPPGSSQPTLPSLGGGAYPPLERK